jgi:RNA polymerase sigma-70 factor (ECF subfamily)
VLRLLGNEHDARDVLQETYLRAFRAIGTFRSEAAVSTWLHRIAVNCCSTHLARRHRLDADALDEDGEEHYVLVDRRADHDLEAVVATIDERGRLVAALGDLPYALRAAVVLSDVYDMPHEVIASELGISRAAVKVRVHRARRRLRDALFPADVADAPTAATRSTAKSVPIRGRVNRGPGVRPRRKAVAGAGMSRDGLSGEVLSGEVLSEDGLIGGADAVGL